MSHPVLSISNFQGRRAGQPRGYNTTQPTRYTAREPYSTDPFRGLDPYLDSSKAFEIRLRKHLENLQKQESLSRHPISQENESFLRDLSNSNKNEHPIFFRALPNETAQMGYDQHAKEANKLFEEWLQSREEWKRTQDELYDQEARERQHPFFRQDARSDALGPPSFSRPIRENVRNERLGPPTPFHPLSQESREYYPLPKDVLDLQEAQSKARRTVGGQQQNRMNKLQSDFYSPLSRMLLKERQVLKGGYEKLSDLMSDPISGELLRNSRTTPEGRTYNPSTIEGVRRQQLADEQLYGGFTPNNLRRVAEWGNDETMPDRTNQHLIGIANHFLNNSPTRDRNTLIYSSGPTINPRFGPTVNDMQAVYHQGEEAHPQMLNRVADDLQAISDIPANTPFVDPMTRARSTPSQHYPNRSVDDTSQMLEDLMTKLNISY